MAIQLIKEVLSPQIEEFPQPVGKNAYSFKLNISTGHLDVVRNPGGSEVKIPDLSIIRIDDYQETVWSDKLLNFSWSSATPGHLICEIV
jgi:hypothetical protein